MPLFFIISGFLYKPKENFVRNKAKSILIPYFIFSIISFIYWITIERFFREQDISPFSAFINIFLAKGENQGYVFNIALWFLPCLFMTEILFNFLINKVKNKYIKYIILVSSIIGFIFPRITSIRLPFCLDIVFTSIVFYYIGYALKGKLEIKGKSLSKEIIIIIALIFVVIALSILENGANMMNLKYNYYLIFYVTACLGFYMVYMISNKINFNFLKWLGKNSLYIMAIHDPIKRVMIAIYARIIGQNSNQIRKDVIQIVIISIIILVMTSIIVKIINYLIEKFTNNRKEKLA